MDATGHPGMGGRNVQHLVVVDTGTDQGKFGFIKIVQVVTPLKIALAVTWEVIMIMLAMQFAITVHIQVIFEDAAVKLDGMDNVAAIVCIKFNLNIIKFPKSIIIFHST